MSVEAHVIARDLRSACNDFEKDMREVALITKIRDAVAHTEATIKHLGEIADVLKAVTEQLSATDQWFDEHPDEVDAFCAKLPPEADAKEAPAVFEPKAAERAAFAEYLKAKKAGARLTELAKHLPAKLRDQFMRRIAGKSEA